MQRIFDMIKSITFLICLHIFVKYKLAYFKQYSYVKFYISDYFSYYSAFYQIIYKVPQEINATPSPVKCYVDLWIFSPPTYGNDYSGRHSAVCPIYSGNL